MAIPTVEELLTPLSSSSILRFLLSFLQEEGISTTDWSSTSPERAFTEMESRALAAGNGVVPQIVRSVLVDLAAALPDPRWLRLVAYRFYGLRYFEGVYTEGRYRLQAAAGAGPYTIGVGDLVVQGAGGNIYRNTAIATLSPGGDISVPIRAESPGSSYNDAADTITRLLTPLPGVTGSNPASYFSDVQSVAGGTGTITPVQNAVAAHLWEIEITTTGGLGAGVFRISKNGGSTWYASGITIPADGAYGPDGEGLELTFSDGSYIDGDLHDFASPGDWRTQKGADDESSASLAARCKARWPSLAAVPLEDKYVLWAREAGGAQVTRVTASADPATAALVNIFLAGPDGDVLAGVVNQVQAYIVGRMGLTDVPAAQTATGVPLALAGTVYIQTNKIARATQDIADAISAYLRAVPIGGITGLAVGGVVPYSEILGEVTTVDGVLKVGTDFKIAAAPGDDLELESDEVPKLTQDVSVALTIIGVG